MSTYMPKAGDITRKWYVIDAAGKPLGKVAAKAAELLRGKHKATFAPHADCGDHVIVINAHSFTELEAAFAEAKTVKGKPTVIIANSVKGKGVSYMENKCEWHGQAPKEDLYLVAKEELEKIGESLK